jgi:hypothetical protein
MCLIFLAGCSTPAPYLSTVAGRPGVFLKERPVSDRTKALHYIENQINFLHFTFEQSVDPYYGTPKWTEACLKANKIGALKETKQSIEVKSTLYVNQLGEVGHCPENPKAFEYFVAIYYCQGSDKVIEVRVPLKIAKDFRENLCPN